MAEAEVLRKLLAEEFGITSNDELVEATRTICRIDFGVFTSPPKTEKGEKRT